MSTRWHTKGHELTGSPVSETVVDAVAGELLRARSAKHEVTLEASVHDLDQNLAVREADDQTVLGRVAILQSVLFQSLRLVATYYLFFAWVTNRLRA